MRLILAIVLFVSMALAVPEGYTTKFDNINLDEVLGNERLLKKYLQCLLEDTNENCTPEGKELKEKIAEALQNNCAKCNDKQKAGVKKVIKFLAENYKKELKQLLAKYDSEGEYVKKYKKQLEEEGIKLD